MSCEDWEEYELKDSMKITEDGRTVLDIVRRVLRARTDWVAHGQVLMEEILAEVEKARESGKP